MLPHKIFIGLLTMIYHNKDNLLTRYNKNKLKKYSKKFKNK